MRNIEEKMIDAIRNRSNFSLSNTRVYRRDFKGMTSILEVYLHDNKIAQIDFEGKLFTLSDCGWATSTTKSRLNAILAALGSKWYIFQKDFVWYISNGKNTKVFQNNQLYSL